MSYCGSISDVVCQVLLADYVKYHQVFVIGSALFASWAAYDATRALFKLKRGNLYCPDAGLWSIRRALTVIVVSGLAATLLWTLLSLVNLSNVVEPEAGFANLISTISEKSDRSQNAFNVAVTRWLQSSTEALPAVISEAIGDRRSWQLPKAIICTIILLAVLLLKQALLAKLIIKAGSIIYADLSRRPLILTSVYILLPTEFVLMVLALANTQASFAPLLLTLSAG